MNPSIPYTLLGLAMAFDLTGMISSAVLKKQVEEIKTAEANALNNILGENGLTVQSPWESVGQSLRKAIESVNSENRQLSHG